MTPETQINMGPCCACRQSKPDVRNVLCLHKLAPVPGTGWGNVLLKWPSNGAVAIVCDSCLDNNAPLLDAVSGYPAEGGRVPVESLQGSFGDDAPEEYRMEDPGDDDEPRYEMPPDEDDHEVPIVLFKMDENDQAIGATEISDDQAAQMFGTPGFTTLSLEQTKALYGMNDRGPCACINADARSCYEHRYGLEGLFLVEEGEPLSKCECACHHGDVEDELGV